jgi:hypothetical protein
MARDPIARIQIRSIGPPDNFDDFWRIASKIFPVPSFTPPPVDTPSSNHPRSQSMDPGLVGNSSGGAGGEKDGAYQVRNVPVRIYLPDGPVLQDVVPPLNEEGAFAFCASISLSLLFCCPFFLHFHILTTCYPPQPIPTHAL